MIIITIIMMIMMTIIILYRLYNGMTLCFLILSYGKDDVSCPRGYIVPIKVHGGETKPKIKYHGQPRIVG